MCQCAVRSTKHSSERDHRPSFDRITGQVMEKGFPLGWLCHLHNCSIMHLKHYLYSYQQAPQWLVLSEAPAIRIKIFLILTLSLVVYVSTTLFSSLVVYNLYWNWSTTISRKAYIYIEASKKCIDQYLVQYRIQYPGSGMHGALQNQNKKNRSPKKSAIKASKV